MARKNYANSVQHTATATPQSKQARADQVENNAGGFTFKVGLWDRFDRFLVLGADAATYYVNRQQNIDNNYDAVLKAVEADAMRAVDRIVEISHEGRAPKNAPAVFALAVVAAFGDKAAKEAAFRAMPRVARTATDFFSFVDQYKALGGGFGAVARAGIKAWYQDKEISQAAYQIVKYRQRDGWTHLDALRLAHVNPRDAVESNLYAFAKFLAGKDAEFKSELLPEVAQGFILAQGAKSAKEVVKYVNAYNLPREAIPTQFLNEKVVWEALLPGMGATALVRNLGKMTNIGLIAQNSNGAKFVEQQLSDKTFIQRGRMHPVTILNALEVYKSGRGVMGSLSWTPNRRVVDGLDAAFYAGFKTLDPTGKKFMLAIDISGSMDWQPCLGGFQITPRVAAAAMAMATAKVEDDYLVTVFSSGRDWRTSDSDGIQEVDVSPRQRLDGVMKSIDSMWAGATDCALPMMWAEKKNIDVDTFVVYTDNETWAGRKHPFQALQSYRRKVNPKAKLVVAGMTATDFTIADPSDAGMMDVAGFDSNVPGLIANFARD